MTAAGPAAARLGLFSTLTGAGSAALVSTVAAACRDGLVPGAEVAFLFVDREPGESAETDAAAARLEAAFGLPTVRVSAVRFEPEARRAARAAAAAGDPAPLEAWRDAWYATFADRLPPTDADLLLGDMWIWGPAACRARRGLNLHPAAPDGPKGEMWFDVLWDLVAADAGTSGVYLHRVTPEVDEGPVATFCRYGLRGPELAPLWAALPADPAERAALVARERALRRDSRHPLFVALRAAGLARELPLVLETARALAQGRVRLNEDGVVDGAGRRLGGGLDLTPEVERAVDAAAGG